jgi:hypothetical protein
VRNAFSIGSLLRDRGTDFLEVNRSESMNDSGWTRSVNTTHVGVCSSVQVQPCRLRIGRHFKWPPFVGDGDPSIRASPTRGLKIVRGNVNSCCRPRYGSNFFRSSEFESRARVAL